jgi:hypothetical protein
LDSGYSGFIRDLTSVITAWLYRRIGHALKPPDGQIKGVTLFLNLGDASIAADRGRCKLESDAIKRMGLASTVFLFILFVWLPCTFYASTVASEKGFSGFRWGLGALLFGPVALIAAAGLPVKHQSANGRWENDPDIQRAIARKRI